MHVVYKEPFLFIDLCIKHGIPNITPLITIIHPSYNAD